MDTNRDRESFDLHPEEIVNRDVGYDRTDLSARGVVVFLIGLALVGVIIHFSLWGVYRWLAKGEIQPTAQPNPMVTSSRELRAIGGDPTKVFPAPVLQPDDVADMNKLRQREEEILNNYGWVDESKGVARVPIDRAMQMLTQQGLPVRPQGEAQTQARQNAGAKSETGAGTGPSGYEPGVKK